MGNSEKGPMPDANLGPWPLATARPWPPGATLSLSLDFLPLAAPVGKLESTCNCFIAHMHVWTKDKRQTIADSSWPHVSVHSLKIIPPSPLGKGQQFKELVCGGHWSFWLMQVTAPHNTHLCAYQVLSLV